MVALGGVVFQIHCAEVRGSHPSQRRMGYRSLEYLHPRSSTREAPPFRLRL